jgi:hypothetical protein
MSNFKTGLEAEKISVVVFDSSPIFYIGLSSCIQSVGYHDIRFITLLEDLSTLFVAIEKKVLLVIGPNISTRLGFAACRLARDHYCNARVIFISGLSERTIFRADCAVVGVLAIIPVEASPEAITADLPMVTIGRGTMYGLPRWLAQAAKPLNMRLRRCPTLRPS